MGPGRAGEAGPLRRIERVAQRSLEVLFEVGTVGDLSDAELLDRFLGRDAGRAESAFAALVERHGAMVLSVCRRGLGDEHDAQDAFQATFLALARRAGAIRRRDSVACWLFGVADRVSVKMRGGRDRRRAVERRAGTLRVESQEEAIGSEANHWPALREELARLPEAYRAPTVLCYMEGMTNEAAAARLRLPVGTVKTRLRRARSMLHDRLVRRGVTASVALLAGLRPEPAAAAGVARLSDSTAAMAVKSLAGLGHPAIPPAVAVLARGALGGSIAGKGAAAAVVLVAAAITAGAGTWVWRGAPGAEVEAEAGPDDGEAALPPTVEAPPVSPEIPEPPVDPALLAATARPSPTEDVPRGAVDAGRSGGTSDEVEAPPPSGTALLGRLWTPPFEGALAELLGDAPTGDIRALLIVPHADGPPGGTSAPRADGQISLGEYGPPLGVDFTTIANPGHVEIDRVAAYEDLHYALYATYTDVSLHVALRVRDDAIDDQASDADEPWKNDGVELFIDGDLAPGDFKPGEPPVPDGGNREGFQLVTDVIGNRLTTAGDFTADDWIVETSRTPDGYIAEFEIPLALIDVLDGPGHRSAGAGSLLRFNAAVNDNDAPVSQQTSYCVLWAGRRVGGYGPYLNGEPYWLVGLLLAPPES